jgi:protein O-mannosyl-transferase
VTSQAELEAPPSGSVTRRGFEIGAATIIALALASSLTSMANGFAFDDLAIIVNDTRVHTLAWRELLGSSYWGSRFGASLYRPLTTVAFAIEWALGRGTPWVFHLASVLLYASVCVALFAVARRVLTAMGAWLAAAFFAVHPVHVEAVANVVSQSELLTALWSLIALALYLRARASGRAPSAQATVAILLLSAAAFLSKEHGFVLPGVLLAAEATVVRDARPPRERFRALWPLGSALSITAVALLALRSTVLGGLIGEQMVVEMDWPTRIWTIFGIVPDWIRLFLWPAHLSADYSPHTVRVLTEPSLAIVPGVVLLVGGAALLALAMRRARPAAFGLLWTVIAMVPVSNLFSGFLIAERTLLLPSAGVCIALGWLFSFALERVGASSDRGIRRAVPAVWAVVVVLLALGTWRSAWRQLVWKDNATLFAQMVKDSPLGYRAHYLYGVSLFEQGKPTAGERELRQAIALNEVDSDPRNYLATQYRMANLHAQAIPLYREALRLNPYRPDSRYGLAHALMETGDLRGARVHADSGLAGGQMRGYFEGLLQEIERREPRGGK